MKKLILFFIMASLAVLGTACSSDDSNGGGHKELALLSDANADGIVQGTTVEFTVMAGEGDDVVEVEEGVSFYVNETEVKNPYTFKELGEFKVVAKKNGYKESNTLIIKVIEGDIVGPGDKEKLVLSVVGGETEVEVGDLVTFEVKDKAGINVTDASIMLSDDTSIGYDWKPSDPGTYKIFAFKTGYEKSEGVVVTVKEKVEKTLVLALEEESSDLYIKEEFRLTIKDGDGVAVSDAILYKNGTATAITSSNGIFKVKIDVVGSYALKAVHEGVESNVIDVRVKDKQETPNSFTFQGSTYRITQSTLFFTGIEPLDEEETMFGAAWQVEATEAGGKIAIVMFYTPAYDNGNGDFTYLRPTATNTLAYLAGIVQNRVALAVTSENIAFVFGATTTNSTVYTGEYEGDAPTLGDAPFGINFNGATNFIDDSRAQGIRGVVSATARQGNRSLNAGRMVKTKTLRALSR